MYARVYPKPRTSAYYKATHRPPFKTEDPFAKEESEEEIPVPAQMPIPPRPTAAKAGSPAGPSHFHMSEKEMDFQAPAWQDKKMKGTSSTASKATEGMTSDDGDFVDVQAAMISRTAKRK